MLTQELIVPELIESTTTERPKLIPLGSMLDGLLSESEHRYQCRQTGKLMGPIVPLTALNEQYGGFIPNGLHTLLGHSGSGKTAFALQVASGCGCPCLYISCEMSPIELLRRTIARETKTELRDLKNGFYTAETIRTKALTAIQACPDLAIVDGTTGIYIEPGWIYEAAKVIKRDSPYLLIIVDSIHSWACLAPDIKAEYENLNGAIADLQALASSLTCPIIGISEMNRSSQNPGAERLTASKGTGKFEFGSESVLSLEKNPDAPITASFGEIPLKIRFAKNRNGAAGKDIALTFTGGYQHFQED